ncbi:MAG: aspartate aminotransferase family protein [Clostridia bacterium]|nr:aspartate aminotransferase family protein [Clostridia bacterium]
MMHVYKRVPVVLESGYGSVAYDIDHKKYIDFTSGIGVNVLGFANGSWSDAVEKQIDMVQHTSNIYYNRTQINLAEQLCTITGFSKVFFANSGAEANECAIKLARKYGSDKYGESHTHIVTLENSFHGRTIATLAATGQDAFHKYFTPFTKGFSYAKANDMESIKAAVTEDTCAVMIELIQGEGGVNPLDREFVTELSQFCNERDILLIVDEIQTGIGRTGKLFCYENYDIKPDVITSAKALGGGLPLSACLCNEKLQDVMTQGTNGTTFGGNTIACAGAMKILDIVADEQFLEEVAEKGEYMRERIQTMNGVKEVRGMGLMIGIVLEKDNAAQVQEKCAENGLLVLTAKNLVRLLPPLNIDMFDIDEGLDILEDVINNTL